MEKSTRNLVSKLGYSDWWSNMKKKYDQLCKNS